MSNIVLFFRPYLVPPALVLQTRGQGREIGAAACAALALAVAIGLGRFGFTAAFPLMVRDGTLQLHEGSVAQALHFVGYFVGAASVVRVPRDRVAGACAAGLGASVVLLAATAFAVSVPWICVDRFLSGVASGIVMVMASTWLFQTAGLRWAPVLYGGAGLGIVAAGESVALLSGYGASGQAAWLALAVAAGALTLLALLAFATGRFQVRAQASASLSRPDLDPRRLLLVYTAGGFGYVISATYLPALVARATGQLDPIHVFSFFGLCAAPSCLLWLRIDAILGTRRALALSYAVQLVGTLLPLASANPVALLIAAASVGGTFMGVVAMAMAAGRRHTPGLGYNLMAILTAAYALGQAGGPAISALVARTAENLDRSLALAALVLATAVVIALLPPRRSEVEAAG